MQGAYAHAIAYAYRSGGSHLKAKVGKSMKLLVTLLGFIRLVESRLAVFHLVIVRSCNPRVFNYTPEIEWPA